MIHTLPGREPQIHPRSFIAPSADIIGQVTLGADASVWYHAVLRGDNDEIRIGARSNVQDGAVLHADPGAPLRIGENVTVGHAAVLHGCEIGDFCLVGIGSCVLNHAVIGDHCIIGANTLVAERKTFPPKSLIIGSPGKVARALRDEEAAELARYAEVYVKKIELYRAVKTL
ncbi:MAG: gamma carbonic anhydrase family protein [Gammaproteobacteria bacterium]